MIVATIAGIALMCLGVFVLVVAAIGLFRLPDIYLRTSAIGTAAGLGVALIVMGVLCLDFSWVNLIKAIVAILAQLLTSAVGSMALARAGMLSGAEPVSTTVPNDLALDGLGDFQRAAPRDSQSDRRQ